MTRSWMITGLAVAALPALPGEMSAQELKPGDIPPAEWVANLPKSATGLYQSPYAATNLFSPCPRTDPARAELFRAIAEADLNDDVTDLLAVVWRDGAAKCDYEPFFDWITDQFVARADAGLPLSVGLSIAMDHPVSARNRARLLGVVGSDDYPEEVRAEAGAHAVKGLAIDAERAVFLELLNEGTLPRGWRWAISSHLAKALGDGFAGDVADSLHPDRRANDAQMTAVFVITDLVRRGALARDGAGVRRLHQRLSQQIESGFGDQTLRAYAEALRLPS